MPIRYRRSVGTSPYEGQVESIQELEALATLGTLTAQDEVSLDGKSFQKADRVPQLKNAFREKPEADSGGLVGNILLIGAVGVAGIVALGLVLKVAAFAVKLAMVVAVGLGAFWLVRKLLK